MNDYVYFFLSFVLKTPHGIIFCLKRYSSPKRLSIFAAMGCFEKLVVVVVLLLLVLFSLYYSLQLCSDS